jgi:hypothetical protein
MKAFLSILKKIILWSYQRGSWQYDLLCILILVFIFLTPSEWFNPEPEPPPPEIQQTGPPLVATPTSQEAADQRHDPRSKKSPSEVTQP